MKTLNSAAMVQIMSLVVRKSVKRSSMENPRRMESTIAIINHLADLFLPFDHVSLLGNA